jgi:hypothetical protein
MFQHSRCRRLRARQGHRAQVRPRLPHLLQSPVPRPVVEQSSATHGAQGEFQTRRARRPALAQGLGGDVARLGVR